MRRVSGIQISEFSAIHAAPQFSFVARLIRVSSVAVLESD
jgi:hypothetical protein